MGCARVDTAGAYRIDGLPLLDLKLSVSCPTIRGFGKTMASDSVRFTDTTFVRRDWAVNTTGCDPRPLREVKGVFRGHYTPGFEASKFTPCASDAWFIPSDSLSYRSAWATWRPGVGRELKWPKAPHDEYGNPTYYVRWRGTAIGPGRYGHLGVAPFEFLVDSVLELRAPKKTDCRG